jgi:hypothetical protein
MHWIDNKFMTNKNEIPDTHTNIKICPQSLANIFNVLSGFVSIKEREPLLYAKMTVYSNLINGTDTEQLDRILASKVVEICDLLIGTLAEMEYDQFRDIISQAMLDMSDEVHNGTMSEGAYKVFCDVNKELLGIIAAIDKHSNKYDDNTFGIHASSRYGKFAPETETKVMDIYIYSNA